MNNPGFRFSYDQQDKPFTFRQFRAIATELEGIVRSCRDTIDYKVLTCEDHMTYHHSTITVPCDLLEKALKRRKQYSLDEINQDVWDISYKTELIIKDPSVEAPFMICLTFDKTEKERLFFYGQGLDQQIYDKIMQRFHKEGELCSLGDGFPKPSDFNAAYLMSQFKG